MAPKDKDHLTKKSGIIYRYKCDRLECDEEYIGETARTFGERYKEDLKAPSPIHDHCNISGHNITLNNFSTVGREEHNLSRLIKESMFIRVNNPSLNKNIGKYHLPHIWDEVLINNIELKLKEWPCGITSATKAITSALNHSNLYGYSICHGNNISQTIKWPFHLPQLYYISCHTCGVPSATWSKY